MRRATLGTLGGFVLDLLAIAQATEAIAFDDGEVNKDVSATGIDDEPKAFFAVEPFHCANRHTDTSARTKRAGPGRPGSACRTATHVWRTHRTVVRDRTLRGSRACATETNGARTQGGPTLLLAPGARIARPAPSSKKNPPQKRVFCGGVSYPRMIETVNPARQREQAAWVEPSAEPVRERRADQRVGRRAVQQGGAPGDFRPAWPACGRA